MKIMHFIGSIDQSSGGTASFLQILMGELIHYADIHIVTDFSPNPLKMHGVKIRFLNMHIKRWFKLKYEFRKLLLEEKPDLVHINGIWNPQNFLFQQEAQLLKIKTIISPHGMLEPYILNRNPLKKKIALLLYQRRAMHSVDFIHATAISEINNIRRLGFKKPASVIPNCLAISPSLQKILSQEDIREVKGKTILFLSRIHPKKGIELLLEAVEHLKDFDFTVIIAGEGEEAYVQTLRNLIKEKELESKVSFAGGVYGSQKWQLYKKADFFVLPTYSENFGLVVIEALAAGLPVITTQGTPWMDLETYRCGWWIELNPENLKNALSLALQSSKACLNEMGKRGKDLVEKKYTSYSNTQKMVKMYKEILSV